MFYDEKTAPPPVPSRLNASPFHTSDFETVDINGRSGQLRPHAHTAPTVTAYLGLRARLSQLWFNRWTILLILVLIRVILLTGSLDDNIGDAKAKALSACTKVEDIGSAMASMPHYLSRGVNSLASSTITKTVSGMVQILMMMLTAVESLIFFVINMYVGTFVCVVTALIHGTLDVAIKVVEEATDKINGIITPITKSITDKLSKAQILIDGLDTGISFIDDAIPDINISGFLDDLKDIKIDSKEFVRTLVNVNKTIPTFDQVEKFAKNAIGIPFDFLKDQVNGSLGNYKFDDSVFPVAKRQALSFCSGNSFLNDFFGNLSGIVSKARIAFAVVIPILAIAAMVGMGYLEIRRWRRETALAREFHQGAQDPLDFSYLVSRPMTGRVGLWLSSKFAKMSEKNRLLIRWTIAYSTSFPALFVLSLAFAGFFSCFCQFVILRSLQKEAPALASQVGNFAEDVVGTLQEVSTGWADGANGVIIKLQDDMNDDLFGWVTNATAAVNNTLETFDNEIDKAITSVFKDTILLNTARNLVGCIIGRKIDAVQKGLTWVHDMAHVNLPLFSNDLFSQGANDSVNGESDMKSFLASPASVTTDEITDAVHSVISKLEHSLIQEALISTGLLLVYLIVVLVGVVRALVAAATREKTRAEGGEQYGIKAAGPPSSRSSNDISSIGLDANRGEDPFADQQQVYLGTVKSERPAPARYPSHMRKSSHPEVDEYRQGI
ncbi:plasma membrane fusion protein prm1 [Collariella sp. IMI 366227]|nr:plasma membrane fusion protein prm1 [Collariella sp. IMI 366227]